MGLRRAAATIASFVLAALAVTAVAQEALAPRAQQLFVEPNVDGVEPDGHDPRAPLRQDQRRDQEKSPPSKPLFDSWEAVNV